MKGLTVITVDEVTPAAAHPIAGHSIRGAAQCRLVSPDDFSLWMVDIAVEGGAEIVLPAVKGDQSISVRRGSIEVDGVVCAEGGAIVIEAAAHPVIRAVDDAILLHMGPAEPDVPIDGINGPPLGPGNLTHVVGPGGWYAASSEGRDSRYFADSTCPTCRLTLLYTSRSVEYVSPTHSHSQDELIHILWGEIKMGSLRLGPGATLAVAADRRYGFRADANGFGFLNYRRDASQQTVERGGVPLLEGALVNGFHEVGGVVSIGATSGSADDGNSTPTS